jgi:signal transduction histidine kinase
VREFLRIVQSSADRLVAITNDILETSRIEAGQVTLNPEPYSIGAMAQAVMSAMEPLARTKGLGTHHADRPRCPSRLRRWPASAAGADQSCWQRDQVY